MSREIPEKKYLLVRHQENGEDAFVAVLSTCDRATANEIVARLQIADHSTDSPPFKGQTDCCMSLG